MNALVIHEGKNITEKKYLTCFMKNLGGPIYFILIIKKKPTGLMGYNLCQTDFASHQKITLKVTLKNN